MIYGSYPDLSQVRRVLIIKLRQLGDVLLCTPLFSILQNALPQAKIDAYVYHEAEALLRENPSIHDILSVKRREEQGKVKRLFRDLSRLFEIRQRQYDLVIQLTEGDRGALAARWSRASIRVGIDSRSIYTHRVKQSSSLRHMVEKQLDALRCIGIFPPIERRELFFPLPSSVQVGLDRFAIPERFFVIHPTSRWRFKCWPMDKMKQFSLRWIERGEFLVFTSGKDLKEREMIDEITKDLPPSSFLNLAGKTSLLELGALINRCQALLCVDSLPFHIASALKAPVVALFGPTSEKTWGPWRNPNARIVTTAISCRPCYLDGCGGSKMSDCLQMLPVDRVILELEALTEIRSSGMRVVY